MTSFRTRSWTASFVLLLLIALLASDLVLAQSTSTADDPAEATNTASNNQAADATQTIERLEYIQDVLSQKLKERTQLGERIELANEQDKNDLRRQADELTNDIQQLRTTLESIAIGGVDTSLFVTREEEPEGDWREDVALIAQPVIDSLKELTEKPRRLKELNDLIALRQLEMDTANEALTNLAPELEQSTSADLDKTLQRFVKTWEGRRDDARSAIDIAQFQIADLQGDKSIPQTIVEALIGFVKGRGLTIVLAVLAGLAVWFGVRFMLRGYRASLLDKTTPEGRTRYRLAAYSVHALTFVLILIAIFVVFYERGDVLLLGLLILLIIGLALGVRNLLPRYVSEARLLLNIGAMREAERIVYRDLPWRVESINMYTVLKNPELHGVLRIPLAEFHGVSSRPTGKDSWFPTSKGDIVLVDNETLLEVIDQNPDTVELRHRGGQIISVPTSEFYKKAMTNLSRGGSFGVINKFGVGYELKEKSHDAVPKALRDRVRQALQSSDLSDFVKDVLVEFSEVSPSSLDYWIFVTMDSKAAKSYLHIQRLVQSACVEICTEEQWPIPYPHLSVVRKPA
ncbi:MAG: hypothetical protein AB8B79_00360 [Granulosicoccus sp.]